MVGLVGGVDESAQPLEVRAVSTHVVAATRQWARVEVAVASPSSVAFSVSPSGGGPVVLQLSRRVAGGYLFEWRGRAMDGRPVPDGRYVLEVSAPTGTGPVSTRIRLQVSNDPGPPEPVAPPPPGGVAVVASAQNTITWSPGPAPDAVSYRVYRAPSRGGPYTWISEVGVERATDRPPEYGIYWYRVSAVDVSRNEGTPSGPVSSDNVRITAIVGPAGGTLAPTTGTVALAIPPGAVAAPTTFTIRQLRTAPAPNVNRIQVSRAFEIDPSGTSFERPAHLTLRFRVPPSYRLPSHYPAETTAVQFWDAGAGRWESFEGTSVEPDRSLVRAPLPHLSTVVAASATNPHGGYSSQTQLCVSCHEVHGAQGEQHLFRRPTERETCYQCHNGTGARTDIQADFGEATLGTSTRVSWHPLPASRDGIQLLCADCHTPHKLMSEDTALLSVFVDGGRLYSPPGSPIGNAFCYACHGPGSVLPTPLGDHSSFEGSAHDTGRLAPRSGSGIKCLSCHAPHGSDYAYLATAPEEQLCLSCHQRGDPNTSGGSNPALAFTSRANDYSTSDGTPIRIFHHPIDAAEQEGGARSVECASCHSPHISNRYDSPGTSKIVDPANTSSKWQVVWGDPDMLRGNINQWCEKCHQNPGVTQPISPGPGVPYPIALKADTAPDAGGQPHDLFGSWEYDNSSKHGLAGLACTACHDFHGSSNAYMLRENIVGLDGSTTNTLQGFQATDNVWDWDPFKWLCLTCHPDELDHANRRLAAGQVCRSCHFHTSNGF